LSVLTLPDKADDKACKEQGRLVDATFGRRTRAAILTEGGFIVLSAVLPDTLVSRLEEEEEERIEPITEQERNYKGIRRGRLSGR